MVVCIPRRSNCSSTQLKMLVSNSTTLSNMQRQSSQSSKIAEAPVMKLIGGLCTLSVVALTFSCQPSDSNHVNKFADPEIIKIYDFKDRRIADSLYQYFNHTDER